MKKVLLALFTLALCFSSLFANEAAVKQAIIRNIKQMSQGKFAESLSSYTTDFVGIDLDKNEKTYYKDEVLAAKAMDGNHPLEFMVVVYRIENGKEPNAQELKALRAMTQTAEFKKEYSNICKYIVDRAKKLGELELKTIKFISVKVDGNTAIAITEYKAYDSSDTDLKSIVQKRQTIKLRKVNGVWKFYETATKKISR